MTLQTLLDRFDLLMDTPESVPKLRQFILQLAVRGRLTERRSSDTPAEELLEPIRDEKEQLYDDGTIRKSQAKLPKLAKNGEALPDGWISIELERAGVVNPRHDADEDTEASFVPMKRIEDGVGDGHTTEIRPWGEIRRGYTHFMEGDVGLAKITPCFQNRKSTVFRNLNNEMGAGTTELYVFRPLAGTILPEFVLSFFQSQGFIEEGVSRMTGTAGQKRVPREYVEQSLLPLPPLEEQKRIVETVDGLMNECDALEHQQEREYALQVQVGTSATEALQSADDEEALRPAWERVREHFDTVTATPEGVDALRQTIFHLAVQGRLTERDPDDTPADVLIEDIQQEKQRLYDAGEIRKPSTFEPVPESEEPHEIPSEWEWVRVGKVGNTQTGQTPKKSEDRFYGGRYPFLKPDNIENGKATYEGETLTEAGIQDGRMVPAGSVLMVCIGTIGKAAVADRKCSCNQQINYITPYGSLSSLYTLRAMQSKSFQREAERKSRSTTITILNKGNWETIPFPLPPPEEQQRIVDIIDRLLPLCDHLDGQLADLNERGEQLLEGALRDASTDRQNDVPTGVTA